MVNKTTVKFSETRLCIRAWKHEVCNCLKIQFCHLVKLHYSHFCWWRSISTNNFLTKPYSRRTLYGSRTIYNYRLSHVRVVDRAFLICAAKWRILDKAIETKVDTGVETVKCIALLYNIIIDVEGLHDFSSNDCDSLDANGGSQFKNKSECITLLPLLQNKR
jgi:hypothetical protein